MPNLWRQFAALLPQAPLWIGTVQGTHADQSVTVVLIDGGSVRVKGTATPGQRVFVRGSEIVGIAPTLYQVEIEI